MSTSHKFSVKIYIAAFCIVIFGAFVVLEVASREFIAIKTDQSANPWLAQLINKTLPLDGYEMASPDVPFHWLLRPGYAALSNNVAKEKKAAGKLLGMQAFAPDLTARPSDPAAFRGVSVNAMGFRGPEISLTDNQPKIIAIGDSVTFGLGEVTYPSELGYILKKHDADWFVMNAGVEGYALRNHEIELARYKRLKPRAAIIFLGWNDLYALNVGGGWAANYSVFIESLVKGWQIMTRPKFAADWENAVSLDYLSAQIHLRPGVERELERLIERYGRYLSDLGNNETKLFIVTLPSLLRSGQRVDQVLLKRAQMPHYAESVDEFAGTVDRFNQLLRQHAAAWGVKVIDLAEWSEHALRPRKFYFLDNVHMTSTALKMIADKIHDDLRSYGVYNDFANDQVRRPSKLNMSRAN